MTEALYDADILLWSEQQAELLRRRAANALDWDNLAEEIQDVGLSELHAVESLLVQALIHMLKVEAWRIARRVSLARRSHTIPRRCGSAVCSLDAAAARFGEALSPGAESGPGCDGRPGPASLTHGLLDDARRAAQRGRRAWLSPNPSTMSFI